MIYPGNGATIKTETFFVESYRFDICEVHPSHYEYLFPASTTRNGKKPASRFFLVVEESHIVNYATAEKWHKETGECRYDWFCTGRADCMAKIASFGERFAKISTSSPKTEEGLKRLNDLKESTNQIFGTNF